MNKVLKLQRFGLMTPTVVEYEGKVLATNQLDIESTCNLWRCHFGFYPIEKIDLAMTKKNFSVIQQKTLSSVKSVYDLFYERNFIPRVFDSNEEVSKWGVYRTNEVEKLKSENAALRERLEGEEDFPVDFGDKVYTINLQKPKEQWKVNCGIVRTIAMTPSRDRTRIVFRIKIKYRNGKEYILGKTAFVSKDAAEARLAELKGERNEDYR